MDLFQTLLHWSISYGNGCAEIIRNGRGEAVEMWPIHPSRIKPRYKNKGETLVWDVTGTTSTIDGAQSVTIELPDEDVFNLRGLGGNGVTGYSIFAMGAESIGQGIAVQNFASTYFKNGTSLTGVIESPSKLDKKAYDNLRGSWASLHQGSSDQKHKMAILEQGMKFNPISTTAQEVQLIEAQKFTVERIARLLRIPPHKIGHNASLVKSNYEEESRAYHSDTLTPWIKRISLEADRKIIRDDNFTAGYQVSALTFGDSKTRTEVFKAHRDMGTMSINDVLRLEDQNIIEEDWANDHHMQLNITTVQAIAEGKNLSSGGESLPPEENTGDAVVEEEQDESEDMQMTAPDSSELFMKAKVSHLPSFKYSAKKIVEKEAKAVSKKLISSKSDRLGFIKWSEAFFQKQTADIVDAFTPCCEVFTNSVEFSSMTDLEAFSESYAKDGAKHALTSWDLQVKGHEYSIDTAESADNMAENIINLIEFNDKGAENEA